MLVGGYWVEEGPGYFPKYHTVWSLILLAQLGATFDIIKSMQTKRNWPVWAAILPILSFLFSACGTVPGGLPMPTATLAPTRVLSASPIPQQPTQTAAPASLLPIGPVFSTDSRMCAAEPSGSMFFLQCQGNTLAISQNDTRRKMDIQLMRDLPVEPIGSFVVEAVVRSELPTGQILDRNQYGLVLGDTAGTQHILRLQGQEFIWETWLEQEGIRTVEAYDRLYSPTINPAGRENRLQLACAPAACDVRINNQFIARLPHPTPWELASFGLLAASDWDETFGTVTFLDLTLAPLDAQDAARLADPAHVMHDLTAPFDLFSGMGLSGAFNQYDQAGYHFSPVIPYDYYAVTTTTAYVDVSVSADVTMEIDPARTGTQFGGLLCRASRAGMVMAVIRVDGTYSLYRQSQRRGTAILAEGASEAILPGRTQNRLQLDCVDDQITFFINGKQVADISDARYGLNFGGIGFYTKAGGSPSPDAIVFNNLVIIEQ